jgi:hypothetical protein
MLIVRHRLGELLIFKSSVAIEHRSLAKITVVLQRRLVGSLL